MRSGSAGRYGVLAIGLATTMLVGTSAVSAQDGGTPIIKAISGDVQTIDPRLNFQPRASEMIANMYDQLTTYETVEIDGQLYSDPSKPIGLLAESWDISDDGLTWTWHLREGVKFHSGNTMTCADVLYSFERNAKLQEGGWFDHQVTALYEGGNEDSITDVLSCIDDTTLEMRFLRATPYVPQVFANAGVTVYDSKLMLENATEDDPWSAEWIKENDAGTGPFKLSSIEPGVGVTLDRFDDYFRGPAAASQIIYRVIPSAADRALLLEQGEIDFAEELDLATVVDLEGSENVQIISFDTNDQLKLMMSYTDGPTADQKVRQAISWAVPYDDIVEGVYFGRSTPGGGPIPIGSPGFDPDAPFYSTDLDKAKAALAESGYPDGFDMTISIDSSRPAWEQTAILIQAALAELGINVTIDPVAPANFNDQFFASAMPVFLFQGGSWVDEPTYHMELWWEEGSYGNRVNYKDAEVDALLLEAKTSTDEAVRQAAFDKVQEIMLGQAPAVWLGQPDLVIATAPDISGYIARPDQITRFYSISPGA